MTMNLRSWSTWPRAMRWMLVFVLVVAAYFLGVEPGVEYYAKVNNRAQVNEATLLKFEQARDVVKHASDTIARGDVHYGLVELPDDPEARSLRFNQAIDAILAANSVQGHTANARVSPMGKGPLLDRFGPRGKIERLSQTIDFTTEPVNAAGVIADLERNPYVSTVSSVQIKQVESRDRPGRLVQATITVESWVLTKKGASR